MKNKIWLGLLFLPISSAWSLDLVESYQLALVHDPSWQGDNIRFQVEQQNLGIAKGAILPVVGVSASMRRQYQNDDSGDNGLDIGGQQITFYEPNMASRQLAVSVRQPVFRMDVWEQYLKVKVSQELAELKLQSQQQDLMLNVAQSYFSVLHQQRLLEVYQQEENVLLQQYKMIQAKEKEGLTAWMDVREAEAQYQSAVANRIAGEVQYQLAVEQFQQLTGTQEKDLAKLQSDFQYQAPVPADVKEWISMAERNNLDLNQSRVAYRIAKQQIKVDQAEYYPQVEAVVSTGWNKQSPETSTSANGRVDQLGIELNWVPYTGVRSKIIQKSRLEADVAQTDIATVLQKIQTETKRRYLQVETGVSQLKAYQTAMESADLVAKASQASYQEGLKTMVDVLLAQRHAFAAKQDFVNAQYDYILNVLQLRAVSGQLGLQDLIDFNQWLN